MLSSSVATNSICMSPGMQPHLSFLSQAWCFCHARLAEDTRPHHAVHAPWVLQLGCYLKAMPVSLPSRAGRTLPTALAAPVAEGMMLPEAARPPLQSFLEGPSTVFCVAVELCTVVIRASLMPKESCSTCLKQALS